MSSELLWTVDNESLIGVDIERLIADIQQWITFQNNLASAVRVLTLGR